MKNIISLVCILIIANFSSLHAQNLFSYGTATVGKNEFAKAFLKNNKDEKPNEKAWREYLELYIRFKLKVKAAYDLRLDTLPNQKAELSDFRNQVAGAFLNDETSYQTLVNEAFLRSQKDIHLAHIYIPFTGTTNLPGQEDTVKAWKLATDAYNELQRGTDFRNVAVIYSADPSVRTNKGDVGYITVFTLPYELENVAYTTPEGKFSKPFRTRVGYHIFKNLGERKAVGKMKAAQILFAFPPDADTITTTSIKRRADSVYKALVQGASFAEMVRKYSNDNASYASNGEMPEFGIGKFDANFENAVLSLKTGVISQPVLTPQGYHIIKRLEQIPVNADSGSEEAMALLKRQVQDDNRMEVSRKAMLQKIYRVTGFKKGAYNEKDLLAYADSSLNGKNLPKLPGISNKTLLFSFPKQNVYADEFIKYLQAARNVSSISRGKSTTMLLNQFGEMMAQEYYLGHLETYNAGFAEQVKEFKEGNLLFEVMQRSVWEKAANDSVGLKKFFELNKSKYWWEPSADAIIFSTTDSAIATELRNKVVKNESDWRTALQAYSDKVRIDSGRFELTLLSLPKNISVTGGTTTQPAMNASDNNSISFVHIIKVYREKAARNFDDAKGLVTNDYQAYLEEKWIEQLKKKYPVKVNEPLLQTLWK